MFRSRQVNIAKKGRILRGEDGNVLVLTAFGLTFLLGFLALASDTGRILFTQRQIQGMADAAAIAGAAEISTCGATSNCTAMQTAAKSALTENGATGVTVVTQCGTSANSGIILTVNNGPCTMGTTDPNHGNTNYVEAMVSYPVNTFFAALVNHGSFTVQARSEAGGAQASYCIYVLNPTASSAVTFNGSSNLVSPTCGIMVDSSSSSAVMFDSGSNISTSSINIVGGYTNNGGTHPTPNTGVASVADPLASLATPTVGSCGTSNSSPYTGAASNVSLGSTATLNPGVYCGGMNFNGGTYTVTMNPGTYIFTGAVNVDSGVTLKGTGGVTLYFSSGSLQLNSGSIANLVAPTTGTYAGILYFQSRTNSTSLILDSGTTSVLQGVIYAADAQLTVNSDSSSTAYTQIVVNTLMMDSSDTFNVGTNYSSLANGSPIKSGASMTMAE